MIGGRLRNKPTKMQLEPGLYGSSACVTWMRTFSQITCELVALYVCLDGSDISAVCR